MTNPLWFLVCRHQLHVDAGPACVRCGCPLEIMLQLAGLEVHWS